MIKYRSLTYYDNHMIERINAMSMTRENKRVQGENKTPFAHDKKAIKISY